MKSLTLIIASLLVLTPALVYAAPGSVIVDVDGADVTVNYDAEGVDVLSAEADLDFISLIIDVEVTGSQILQ